MQDIAMLVGEDLDFDVLGATDEFFQENGTVAEGAQGLGLSFFEQGFEVFFLAHHTHATTATAEGSFDDQWEADFFRGLHRQFAIFYGLGRALQGRHLEFFGNIPRRGFVTHAVEDFGIGTDENDAIFLTSACEIGVL